MQIRVCFRRQMIQLLDEYIDRCNRSNDESFVTSYARIFQDEFDIKGLNFFLRDLMCAGTETSTTAISWTIVYLANNPEWQRRLRSQVRVVWPSIATILSQWFSSFWDHSELIQLNPKSSINVRNCGLAAQSVVRRLLYRIAIQRNLGAACSRSNSCINTNNRDV